MDYRTLSKLIVKLGGAFILVQTISWWPSYLTPAMELLKASPGAFVGAAIVPLLLPFIAGVVLFAFPGTIANKVLMPEAQPDSNSIASQQIERVLLSVLGVYLAFRALADLAFGAAKLITFRQLFEEQAPNAPLPPTTIAELYGNLFASGVEFVVAASLILGVAGIQAFLARLRGTDSF